MAQPGHQRHLNGSYSACCRYQIGAAGPEGSSAMTNAEKDLLIAYLVDAGDIDPTATLRPSSWSGTRSRKR